MVLDESRLGTLLTNLDLDVGLEISWIILEHPLRVRLKITSIPSFGRNAHYEPSRRVAFLKSRGFPESDVSTNIVHHAESGLVPEVNILSSKLEHTHLRRILQAPLNAWKSQLGGAAKVRHDCSLVEDQLLKDKLCNSAQPINHCACVISQKTCIELPFDRQ
ncbi:hypothetical protein AG1IA_05431 [Rhizoctonia solani AG-1 IA]|uniref:Uncharacterized protein n=1 Tax=Thanatephorus cucumeris (strain AG1-IA) TaxID=983506 RepID=L8WR94_THACA|nr:hypothetical protein AG1IA_05431 [Rhizoctonia solani AG-1 IA]